MPALLELNPTVDTVCSDVEDMRKVSVRPLELVRLTRSYTVDMLIEQKVGATLTQSCSKDGFVLSGPRSLRAETHANRALCKPLRILTRSSGEVPPEHLNGSFVYRVSYSHFVCNPPLGVVIPVVVTEKNKLGIRGYYYPYTYDADTNEVLGHDVARGGAQFMTVFLPKALHCSGLAANSGFGVDDPDDDPDDPDDLDDDASVPADGNDSAPERRNPKELYEAEEARIDANETDDAQDDYERRKRVIIHARVLQKRFDINDKQISVVAVLDH